MRKSRPAVWRDAIRDSELPATAKLVAHTLSTYLNGSAYAYPGRETLAAGSSLSVRSVERRIRQLEAAGFLRVEWSKGGRERTHRYAAVVPETATQVRRSEWETATETTRNGESLSVNGDTGSPESVKESVRKGEGASQPLSPFPESGRAPNAASDSGSDGRSSAAPAAPLSGAAKRRKCVEAGLEVLSRSERLKQAKAELREEWARDDSLSCPSWNEYRDERWDPDGEGSCDWCNRESSSFARWEDTGPDDGALVCLDCASEAIAELEVEAA